MFFSKRQKGQGLVEFALILPVLLLVILGLIETALLFQAYLAIQHGAREAARFAVSMQPPIGHMITEDSGVVECPAGGGTDKWGVLCEGPDENESDLEARREKWQRRRVQMIKARALESSMGVRISEDKLLVGLDEQDYFDVEGHPELYDDYMGVPGFYGVQVRGFSRDEQGELVQKEDHPSLPGLHVRVMVHHRAEVIDPLFQAIVGSVLLTGRMDMINEGLQAGAGPLPTFEPEATPDLGPGPEPEPNDPPDTPDNLSPDEGAIEGTGNPQFAWSEYSDPNGDPQSHFRVQLWPQDGDVSHDSGGVASDASTFTPDDWNLSSGEYCWHVRVRDDRGLWSEYSVATCFWVQVEDNDPPITPVNESPVEAGTCVTIDTAHPQFSWSDFSDPDTPTYGDTQSYLQIRLRPNGAGYDDLDNSRDTGAVASDASAYTPPWYLDDGEYYWSVRVRDNRGLWSSYSLETCFIVDAPYLVVLGDHEEGDPFVLGENVTVVIGNHEANTDYELWWVGPDDVGHSFASVTSDGEGRASEPWSLTDPPGLELIPNGVPGQVYTCTVQSRVPASGDVVAYQQIPVLVPEDLPDLVVTDIAFPDSPEANVPMTITVSIANLTHSTVEGFFDVNVYVDPERPPTQGRPGDSLQWVDGIGPLETRTLTFVITLVGLGDHEVWAYVDATNAVDEGDEVNHYGPVLPFAGCEE